MNRNALRIALASCLALTALAGCMERPGIQTGPDSRPMTGQPRDGQRFAIGIEQHRRPQTIHNHQVTLDRDDFSLMIMLAEEDGVLVAASVRPDAFNAARTGKPLSMIPGINGQRLREPRFNPDRLLVVDADVHHYWYHFTHRNTKFDQAAWARNVLMCRRSISHVRTPGATEPIRINKLGARTVYLVIVNAQLDDGGQLIERQRDWLAIHFR